MKILRINAVNCFGMNFIGKAKRRRIEMRCFVSMFMISLLFVLAGWQQSALGTTIFDVCDISLTVAQSSLPKHARTAFTNFGPEAVDVHAWVFKVGTPMDPRILDFQPFITAIPIPANSKNKILDCGELRPGTKRGPLFGSPWISSETLRLDFFDSSVDPVFSEQITLTAQKDPSISFGTITGTASYNTQKGENVSVSASFNVSLSGGDPPVNVAVADLGISDSLVGTFDVADANQYDVVDGLNSFNLGTFAVSPDANEGWTATQNYRITFANPEDSSDSWSYEGSFDILVPEPATIFLLGLGALGLLRKRR